MELATLNDAAVANFGAAASALAGDTKPILKFDKGDWYLGQEKAQVPAGTKLALNMADAHWGWLLWRDKKVDDRRMVTVASGAPIAARGDLGHHDKDLWEKDRKTLKPIDPWAKTIELPAREIDGDKREVTLSGSSKGWEGCCKALFKAFGEGMRSNTGKVPIVELGGDKYNHTDYGTVKVPTLAIVDWKTPADLVAGNGAVKKSKF